MAYSTLRYTFMGAFLLLKHFLGQTDILVSLLGLGTVKFGRNLQVKYPHSFKLPTDKEIRVLLDEAKSLGINLLDTAPAYGDSETRLGHALQAERKEWIISTKVGEQFINGHSYFDFSATAIEKSITQSLKRLQTDYLDIVLLHSNGEDEKIIDSNAFEVLAKMKAAGDLRAYGMSSKTITGGLRAVEQSDVIMLCYHPGYTDELAVLESAKKLNKGIFIKKAFNSGHFVPSITAENKIKYTFDFILKTNAISSIIIGTLNVKHLQDNAKIICANNESP